MSEQPCEGTAGRGAFSASVHTSNSLPPLCELELDSLLAPVGMETFLGKYWEQAPLLIRGRGEGFYERLLTLGDIDAMLYRSRPNAQDLRIVKDGTSRELAAFGLLGDGYDIKPFLNVIYESYQQGHTITVNHVERRWDPVAALCRNIQEVVHHGVGANLYLTPPKAKGFAAHTDPHEVLVLQLWGTKRWRLYRGAIELLRQGGTLAPQGDPWEVLLEPGDLLYLPRGVVHEAATESGGSLHLTVGIHVVCWIDVLERALRAAAERDVRLRRSLPFGFLGADVQEALSAHFNLLARSLPAQLDAGSALAAVAHRVFTGVDPSPDGRFEAIEQSRKLTLDSIVSTKAGRHYHVSLDNGRASLRVLGTVVTCAAVLEPALRYIVSAQQFAIGSLPAPSETDGKLVLARRLVREGMLQVVRI